MQCYIYFFNVIITFFIFLRHFVMYLYFIFIFFLQDARWAGFNYSLKSTTPGDVYLLLKSSSFITHDLEMPFKVIFFT